MRYNVKFGSENALTLSKESRMDALLLQMPVVQGFLDKDEGVTQRACHIDCKDVTSRSYKVTSRRDCSRCVLPQVPTSLRV